MTKAEIRQVYLTKRKTLDEAEYLHGCQRICDHFFSAFDLSFTKTLHTFLPLVDNKEPDTWLIIDRIRREFPQVRISIPKINPKKNEIESYYFEGLDQLQEGNWGIKEPKQGIATNPHDIDVVLVPMLAFDVRGHRVGYGKGYYDRFLSTCRPDCEKIGLSLFPPMGNIPIEESDIALDWCITPDKIYKLSSSDL